MLPRVEIGKPREQLRKLLRDGIDVIEVLLRPGTKLRAREISRRPGSTENMGAAVLRGASCLQLGKKICLVHQAAHASTPAEKPYCKYEFIVGGAVVDQHSGHPSGVAPASHCATFCRTSVGTVATVAQG